MRILPRINRFGPGLLGLSILMVGWSCASFKPVPMEDVGFLDRAASQTEGDLTVSVVVLSQEEARRAFDSKLYKKKIQPVWVQVENKGKDQFWFLPRGIWTPSNSHL